MTYVGKIVKRTVVLPPDSSLPEGTEAPPRIACVAVALPPDANLPEGTPVRVEPIETLTLAERLKDFIGIVDHMPTDWAEQHDHYIHGTPKK